MFLGPIASPVPHRPSVSRDGEFSKLTPARGEAVRAVLGAVLRRTQAPARAGARGSVLEVRYGKFCLVPRRPWEPLRIGTRRRRRDSLGVVIARLASIALGSIARPGSQIHQGEVAICRVRLHGSFRRDLAVATGPRRTPAAASHGTTRPFDIGQGGAARGEISTRRTRHTAARLSSLSCLVSADPLIWTLEQMRSPEG